MSMLSFTDDDAVISYIRKMFFSFDCIADRAKMLSVGKLFEWWCMQEFSYDDQVMRFPFCLWDKVTYKSHSEELTLYDGYDCFDCSTAFSQICCDLTEELYLTKRGEGWEATQALRYSIGFVMSEIKKKVGWV